MRSQASRVISLFFSAGKRKSRKPRALVGMRVSYPNADDLTEHCFKEIWEGASIWKKTSIYIQLKEGGEGWYGSYPEY